MKKFKRLTAAILCMCVVALCMGFTRQMDPQELAALRAMERQEQALEAYQLLWDSFEKDPESLQPLYPDEYGGEYIDDDKLVLQLTSCTPELMEKYRALCGNSEKVVFEEVQYSYNYLQSFDSVAEELAQDYDVTKYGVRVKENQFVIGINPKDFHAVQQSRARLRTSLPIRIEEAEPMEPMTALVGGQEINTALDDATLGFTGTYGENKGAFVTCGHLKNVGVNNSIYYGSGNTEIGKVRVIETGDNTYGDFSICTIENSNFNNSGQVKTNAGSVYVNGTIVPTVGTTVYKYGKVTGYRTATVFETYTTTKGFNGGYTYGVTICNNASGDSGHGDSGGPVYVKSGSYAKICGIFDGGASKGSYYTIYFTPISYITARGFVVKKV